jgi:D-alanyl-D-alanine carboxypeptidase
MVPASNRKLYAAATIANCLGATTQLSTDVYRDGEDLVVRGDGDPSLGSWRYFREGDFDTLAESLKAGGIASIRDLVIDVSAFDRVIYPGGWKIGNIGSDYPRLSMRSRGGKRDRERSRGRQSQHAGNVLREALFLRGVRVAGVRVNTEPRV